MERILMMKHLGVVNDKYKLAKVVKKWMGDEMFPMKQKLKIKIKIQTTICFKSTHNTDLIDWTTEQQTKYKYCASLNP